MRKAAKQTDIRWGVQAKLTALCIASVWLAFIFSTVAWAQQNNETVAPVSEPEKPIARIVVNVPAYKLYFYRGDELVKTFPVTIGSREFTSPYGVTKQAVELVWNPRWTPPSSDWARGEKPAAPGAANNPLGKLKIRMEGFPFLIHGGGDKSINQAVSHGCVRMRNADALELARLLVDVCHIDLTERQINGFIADRYREHSVRIKSKVEVEFNYDTITVEEGQVHIYPDIYRENTNTVDNLIYVLYHAGIDYNRLSDSERETLNQALQPRNKVQKLPLLSKK